jgi:competence protein ComGC
MKASLRCKSGITLLEVMVVMAVVFGIAAAVLLPYLARSRAISCRISCVNNVKQVSLSYRQWGMDHSDKFPMSLTMTNGGTMDHPLRFQAWVHFMPLSNELNTPKVLVCPEDRNRTEADTFETNLSNLNVSYFVGLEADEAKPRMILSGDRNLTTNGVPLSPGLFTLNTNDVFGWTKAMHNQHGNIGLSDGSVQQYSSAGLQQYLLDNPRTNRLAIP